MSKEEFNKKSLSPEELQELQQIIDHLKECRARDPDYDKRMMEKCINAEVAANPDYCDEQADMKQMLKKAVKPPRKPK